MISVLLLLIAIHVNTDKMDYRLNQIPESDDI